jgi:hypothetical protein
MSIHLQWQSANSVLYIVLEGSVAYQTFVELNDAILQHVAQTTEPIKLIVDVSRAVINPYEIERIRSTQKYLHSYQIQQIIVVDEKKVNRLAMLLLMNLSRPKLQFSNTYALALSMAQSGR